jgi:hypothetical protein
MAKSELERVTEEKVGKGGMQVKMYFDMQSEEQDKLQPLLVDLINERLLKEPGVVYCYGAIEEPIKKDKYFITSAVVTALFENLKSLIWITFKYAPAGIEVLKPQKDIQISAWDLQSILLDISQLSNDYSRYILEKVLKPEDIEQINMQIENRKEVGRKLMQKKEGEKSDPDAKAGA